MVWKKEHDNFLFWISYYDSIKKTQSWLSYFSCTLTNFMIYLSSRTSNKYQVILSIKVKTYEKNYLITFSYCYWSLNLRHDHYFQSLCWSLDPSLLSSLFYFYILFITFFFFLKFCDKWYIVRVFKCYFRGNGKT